MPVVHTAHVVPHSPQQMFDLVADVERYPDFVPLCDGLQVLRRTPPSAQAHEVIDARMSVGYGPIREHFISRVTLDRTTLCVNAAYLDGPFRSMDNRWQFTTHEAGGTLVNFYIAYEFKSRMLQAVVGTVFDRAFNRFVAAFEARAHRVYGDAGGLPDAPPLTV
ncbi:MAG: type II toxin-antitoxin system RatA family toxin [Pseudomonadota bacterium]